MQNGDLNNRSPAHSVEVHNTNADVFNNIKHFAMLILFSLLTAYQILSADFIAKGA